jgi:hypothetical protein
MSLQFLLFLAILSTLLWAAWAVATSVVREMEEEDDGSDTEHLPDE